MSLFQTNIADGIRLTICETDRFKSNYLAVNFFMPLAEETASEYALLSDVLCCGTQSYPTIAKINDRLNYLYGTSMDCSCDKLGEIQCLSLAFDFLRNEYTPDNTDVLAGVIEMMREILFAPLLENGGFMQKNVDSEKPKRISEIESLIANKRAYSMVRLVEEMCKEEPYRIRPCGSVEGVCSATAPSLYAHYQKMLETAQIELFFLGHCDKDALVSELTSLFASQKRDYHVLPKTTVKTCERAINEVVEKIKAEQSSLVIGLRGVERTNDLQKFAAGCVLNDLFGGSASSKLFTNVREKLSLCYTCRSMLHAQKGMMVIYAGIATENKEITQKEIFAQLELCKQGEITDEEISLAKQSLIHAYRALSDRPHSTERFYLNRLLSEDGYDTADFIAAISSVTRDEIVTAAKQLQVDTVFFLEGVHAKGGE